MPDSLFFFSLISGRHNYDFINCFDTTLSPYTKSFTIFSSLSLGWFVRHKVWFDFMFLYIFSKFNTYRIYLIVGSDMRSLVTILLKFRMVSLNRFSILICKINIYASQDISQKCMSFQQNSLISFVFCLHPENYMLLLFSKESFDFAHFAGCIDITTRRLALFFIQKIHNRKCEIDFNSLIYLFSFWIDVRFDWVVELRKTRILTIESSCWGASLNQNESSTLFELMLHHIAPHLVKPTRRMRANDSNRNRDEKTKKRNLQISNGKSNNAYYKTKSIVHLKYRKEIHKRR